MAEEYYKKVCSRVTLQSKKEGFFRDLLENLLPLVNVTQFKRCNSDLERIQFCIDKGVWHMTGAELIFKSKNPEEALAKRLEGNAAFEVGDLQKAMNLYSQSIVRSPVGLDLALVYCNRSALLQKMKENEAAIADTDLAISYGYPENKRHKLYERQASCHLAIKNLQKAKESLNLAKEFSQDHDPNDEKFKKKIKSLESKIDGEIKKGNENKSKNEKPNSENSNIKKNKKFAGASDKFDVKFSNPKLGRYAIVKEGGEEINSGEEILREKPFAAFLNEERMGSNCLHCFGPLKFPIGCDTCSHAGFCSRECRNEADKYHKWECRIFALLIGSGMSSLSHLALRLVTISNPTEFLEMKPRLESKPNMINSSFDYESIYNLSGLENERNEDDFLERTIMAIFLLKCLRIVGYFEINLFKNPDPTEIEKYIGSILLRNLQVLQFNAYEICEYLMESKENFRKGSTRYLGLGIYPLASYFNHSCSPNITRYFTGTTIVMESINRIKPGEPIYDNYGPIFNKMSLKVRQEKLAGRYWFKCECESCTNDWPTLAEFPKEIKAQSKTQLKILKKLEKLEETFYEKGLELMDKGEGEAAAVFLNKYLDSSHDLIKANLKPYKVFHLAQEAVKLCTSAKGSVRLLKK